jgi:hypothetical protein
VVAVDEADHHRDPARLGGDALHGALVRLQEAAVFDQIAYAVPGDDHFGRDEDLRAAAGGLVHRREDRPGVAVDVAAGGIELGKGNAHTSAGDGIAA